MPEIGVTVTSLLTLLKLVFAFILYHSLYNIFVYKLLINEGFIKYI